MLATVASVNGANRLKKYLAEEYSVNAKIIQAPSSLTKEGCGYALRFDELKKPLVAAAARELKINVRAFFRETTESGKTIYIKV